MLHVLVLGLWPGAKLVAGGPFLLPWGHVIWFNCGRRGRQSLAVWRSCVWGCLMGLHCFWVQGWGGVRPVACAWAAESARGCGCNVRWWLVCQPQHCW